MTGVMMMSIPVERSDTILLVTTGELSISRYPFFEDMLRAQSRHGIVIGS